MLPCPDMVRMPLSSRFHVRPSPHVPDEAASQFSDIGDDSTANNATAASAKAGTKLHSYRLSAAV